MRISRTGVLTFVFPDPFLLKFLDLQEVRELELILGIQYGQSLEINPTACTQYCCVDLWVRSMMYMDETSSTSEVRGPLLT